MKLFANELAPWERRKEYYQIIQLGKYTHAQTEAINNQTKAMIAAQLASSSAIIASQQRISEGVDILSYGMERVEQGIHGLQATFEWGISEVVWQIEQNREVLKDILQVLSTPLDTQAKELKKRAEEAYSNGWIDDAEEDFLESEKKNRYDFSIHINLGMIYLFHKIDKEKSIAYFEKAIRYAKPKSPYHASFALLHKGLLLRDFGKIEQAEECTSEAIDLTPNISEAFYQNSQYNAILNNRQKAISMLERAIEFDVNYCEKCHNESDFDPIRDDIITLFEKLRDREEEKTKANFPKVLKEYNTFVTFVKSFNTDFCILDDFNNLQTILDRIEALISRHSYRDYLEANKALQYCSNAVQKLPLKFMAECYIEFRGGQYHYKTFSYEKLRDAVNYSLRG